MPEITIEFDMYCAKCGKGLCNQTEVCPPSHSKSGISVHVEPCERCIDEALDQGYEKGVDETQSEIEKAND